MFILQVNARISAYADLAKVQRSLEDGGTWHLGDAHPAPEEQKAQVGNPLQVQLLMAAGILYVFIYMT